MRVYCIECGARGRVTKTNHLSKAVADLYCQCSDAECGHSWVSTLSYGHTLSPSGRTTEQLILNLSKALTPEGKQMIIQGLGGHPGR